jgi:hypothetical protein
MSSESAVAHSTPGQIAYSQHVNPQWVRLLNLLEMNAGYFDCRTVAFTSVLEVVHSSKRFWQDALELAGRAIRV